MALVPLQQADPLRYKAWIESAQQPQAQLNETNAAAGAAGASAANSMSEVQARQQLLQQQQFLKTAQSTLDKAKDKTGHVDPQTYNTLQAQAGALGIDSNAFDNKFEHSYTDPTNIQYNTATGRAGQTAYAQAKREVESQIAAYNAIPADQKGLLSSAESGKIPLVGNALLQTLAPQAYAYEQGRAGLAASLKGIVGGGQGSGLRITDTELNRWAGLLPSTTENQDVVNGKLQNLDRAIKSTFNTPQGLDPQFLPKTQNNPSSPKQGNNIIQNAGSDIKDTLNGILNVPHSVNQDLVKNKYSIPQTLADIGIGAGKGIANEYNQALGEPLKGGDVVGRIVQHAQQHPVNTALDVLPFLAMGKGSLAAKGAEGAEGATAADAAANTAPTVKMPGKLTQILNPDATKNAASTLRDAAIAKAQAAGKVIKGDNIVSDLKDWADSAKLGNLGQGDAINKAIEEAAQGYSGKSITPEQAREIYSQADSGYTKNGIAKTPIQANIDRGLRDVMAKRLDEVAPGWQQSTDLFSNAYKAEKSGTRKMVQRAAGVGLGIAGLDAIRHVLGL